jgi:hypothetical protein
MARYNLDVHDGERFVRDDEGSEFDSPDAAVQGAARSAAEIGQSQRTILHGGSRARRGSGERSGSPLEPGLPW